MSDSDESTLSGSSEILTAHNYMQGMKGHGVFGKDNYIKPSQDTDTEASEMKTEINQPVTRRREEKRKKSP